MTFVQAVHSWRRLPLAALVSSARLPLALTSVGILPPRAGSDTHYTHLEPEAARAEIGLYRGQGAGSCTRYDGTDTLIAGDGTADEVVMARVAQLYHDGGFDVVQIDEAVGQLLCGRGARWCVGGCDRIRRWHSIMLAICC